MYVVGEQALLVHTFYIGEILPPSKTDVPWQDGIYYARRDYGDGYVEKYKIHCAIR